MVVVQTGVCMLTAVVDGAEEEIRTPGLREGLPVFKMMRLVDHVLEGSHVYLVPSAEAATRFEDERVEAAKGTVWATGCSSWYLDDRGIPFVWPFPFARFTKEMEEPRFADYATG